MLWSPIFGNSHIGEEVKYFERALVVDYAAMV